MRNMISYLRFYDVISMLMVIGVVFGGVLSIKEGGDSVIFISGLIMIISIIVIIINLRFLGVLTKNFRVLNERLEKLEGGGEKVETY